MSLTFDPSREEHSVLVPAGPVLLEGVLGLPAGARGLVVFAHGSGSSHRSPRNRYVARVLRNAGLATLLFDLLTRQEELEEATTGHMRFNLPLLAERLTRATDWLVEQPELSGLPVGYFGASTGGGAALLAASTHPERVRAVVSRGGRPDLAGSALGRVGAPTLLIVGERDAPVIRMNQEARARMRPGLAELAIVPDASHLFEEPGALEEVALAASEFFSRHLARPGVAGRA